jgi:hypothetical protein
MSASLEHEPLTDIAQSSFRVSLLAGNKDVEWMAEAMIPGATLGREVIAACGLMQQELSVRFGLSIEGVNQAIELRRSTPRKLSIGGLYDN